MTVFNFMENNSTFIKPNMLQIYESLLNTDIIKNNIKEITIEPVDANRYIGDLYGLLHNVYSIPSHAFYINMRINNYSSSVEYNGESTIKILDPEIFENIYNIIEQSYAI